jgi:hypothetical protein
MITTVNYYNILKEKTKEMDIDFLLDFLETEIDKHLSKGELSFDIQSDLLKKQDLNSRENILFAIDIIVWAYSKLGWEIELRRFDFWFGIVNMVFQFKTMRNYNDREEEKSVKDVLREKDFKDTDLDEFREHIVPKSYGDIVRKRDVL